MKISLLLSSLCLGAISSLLVANEDFDVIKQIRCELLVARVPMAKAIGLQRELRDPKTVAAGIEKLLGLIEKNEAELVDWPTVTTKSGNRAVAENIREIRYPIEYEMPRPTPGRPVNPDVALVPTPTAPDVTAAGRALPQKPPTENASGPTPAPEKPGADLTTAGPTSFETKNVGVTLEIEPTIGPDGGTVDMNLSSKHVSHLGYRRETVEAKGRYELVVQQPIFDVQWVQTNITLKSGESILLGFHNLKEPKNTVELHILTITILETKVKMPAIRAPVDLGPVDPAASPRGQ